MSQTDKPTEPIDTGSVMNSVHSVTAVFDRPENYIPTVTLCGSTSFKQEYRKANRYFTINGFIVLSVGGFHHVENYELTKSQKQYVDSLHFCKIERSDLVFVIDRGGYIGESTEREMSYAACRNIPVYKMSHNL